MENSTQIKSYLDHEVELAYENIRHCQDMMRKGGDCIQDLSNLIQCIPKDVLKEDHENIKNIIENLEKERIRIFEHTNVIPPKGRNFISKDHIIEEKFKVYVPIRDLAYKEILQIVVNRIHISRGKTSGSFNME